MSRIPKEDYHAWYRAVWTDIGGASSPKHPAPFPVELANRLVRMFSFVADTVLDPFGGSGTTCVAAALAGRNSVGYDIESTFLDLTENRLRAAEQALRLPSSVSPIPEWVRRRWLLPELSSTTSARRVTTHVPTSTPIHWPTRWLVT